MNVKKIFWWRFRPTDEREATLLLKAASVSLSTLVSLVVIIALFADGDFLSNDALPFGISTMDGVIIFMLTSIFVAYIVGAFALRHEEFAPLTAQEYKKWKKSTLTYGIGLAVLLGLGVALRLEPLRLVYVVFFYGAIGFATFSNFTQPDLGERLQKYIEKNSPKRNTEN